MTTYNIAIDGPAGAGKSTIARKAAAELGFIYVDTGAMYRAMALYFIRKGIGRDDEKAIEEACGDMDISLRHQDGVQQVLLNGEDVSGLIRTEEVSRMTSAVSVYGPVRAKLLELKGERDHGRPGYRHLRSAPGSDQDLSDGQHPGTGPAAVPGAGRKGSDV